MADPWPSTSKSLQSWPMDPDLREASGYSGSTPASWPPPPWTDLNPTPTPPPQGHTVTRPTLATVRQALPSAKQLVAQPNRQVTQDHPSQPDPYDPFFIPQSILLGSPISPQTNSKLLQLPPEVLIVIFQKVKIPYFQVSLALTCKTMARVASRRNLLSPWRGYRDKDGLFRLLERKNLWMPCTLRLCRACFRFRPRDPAYWEKELRSPEFDGTKANWYDIFSWFEPKSCQQHRCPWCCVLEYTNYSREGQYVEDRNTAPSARRKPMCPDLNRRIDRP